MISNISLSEHLGTINTICSTIVTVIWLIFVLWGEWTTLYYPLQINDILSRITQPGNLCHFFFRKDEKRNYNIASWLCKIECVLTWLMLICKLRLSNSCFWLKFLMQTLPTPYRLWHNAKIVIVMVVINFYFMRQKIDIFCQGLSGFTLLIFGEAKKKRGDVNNDVQVFMIY